MLTIQKGNRYLSFESFDYPGGELGVRIGKIDFAVFAETEGNIKIISRIHCSRDVMELVLTVDAIRRFDASPIWLILPYMPYGRQDRVCVPGEALSLKAFAGVINCLDVDQVITFDAHSDVTAAVFNEIACIPQEEIITRFSKLDALLKNDPHAIRFVSPDAGAYKKTSSLAAHYGHHYFIRADKLRDLHTGKIKITVVLQDAAGLRH